MDPRKGQAQWQQQQQGGGGTFGSFQQQSGQGVQQQGQQQRQQGRQGYSYSYSSAYSSGPGGEYGQADFSQDKGSGGVEHHHVSWGPGQEPQHHHFSTQGQQQGGQQQGGQQQGGQQQGGQQQGGEQGMPEDLAALQQARNAVQMDSIRAVQGVGGGDGWKDSRMSSRGGGCGVGGSEEEGRRGGERGREVGEKVESRTKEENEEKEKEKEKEKKQEAWSSYETVFTNAKAGMEGVDKERVKRIVYAMSQGSRFFQHEQRKEAALLSKIAHMQRAKQAIPPEKLALLERQADGMLARMVAEASREERRRVWVHVDMDAFYAAVEALGDARLRDVPMAVGGMGMLCTANYETWAGEGEEEASREGRRVWVHVDMDAFYAAVEVLGDARLRDVPMAVGGMGMLCTANYETPLASPRLPLSPSALPPPFPVPLPFPVPSLPPHSLPPDYLPHHSLHPRPLPPNPSSPPSPLSTHHICAGAQVRGAGSHPGFIVQKLCPEHVSLLVPHIRPSLPPYTFPPHSLPTHSLPPHSLPPHSRPHHALHPRPLPPNPSSLPSPLSAHHICAGTQVRVFRQYDPHFVARSLDEAYLDITAVCEDRSMTPAQVAEELRHKVRSRHLENSFPTDCSPCLLLTSSPGPASPSVWQVAEELRHKVYALHTLTDVCSRHLPADCSPCLLLTSSPAPASPYVRQVAEELRHKVHAHTGLTCSAGVAANRMLAKVCSDINKPNGQYVLPFDREAILSFISSLPIRKIGGVGKVTERLLRGVLGVKVCADIITHRGALLALFSPISAEFFLQAALGIGGSGDVEEGPRKSISCERTFSPLSAEPAILNKLVSHTLSSRLSLLSRPFSINPAPQNASFVPASLSLLMQRLKLQVSSLHLSLSSCSEVYFEAPQIASFLPASLSLLMHAEQLSFALAKDLEEGTWHGMKGFLSRLNEETFELTQKWSVRTRAVSVPEPIGSQQEISATSQSFRTHVCTRAHRVTAGGLSFRPLKALLFSSPLPPFLSPPHRPQVRTRAVSVPEPIGSQQEMWPLVVRLIRAELPVSVRLLGLRMSALVPRASSGSSRQATISEVLGGRRAVGGSSAKGAAEGKYSTGSPEGKFPTGPTEGKHSAYMGVKRVEPSKSRGGEGRERLLEENSVEGEGWAHGGAERVEERRLGGEWREHARLPDARVQNETGEEVGGKEELRGCGDGGAELSGCEWEGGWDSESEWEECGEGMAEGMDGGRSGGGEREVREEREEREERDEKEEREEREEREEEEREEREERKEEEIEEREEEEEKERRESENREGREEREEREERMKNTDVEKACAQVGRRRMEERGDEEEEEAKEKEVTLALTQKAFQMPPMSFEDATHYQEGMEKQEMDETFAGEAGAGVPSGKRGKGGKGKKEKATREAATAAAVHRFVIAACSSRRHERSRSIW
ncbi:unnamed protein product [Closterium sp. NIES-65]|nr:unnamed protein product [Closterium sp. NIES-65]